MVDLTDDRVRNQLGAAAPSEFLCEPAFAALPEVERRVEIARADAAPIACPRD